MSHVSHLECSVCNRRHDAGKVQTLCECGGPLLVRYDLEKAKATWNRDSLANAPANMWRYAPLLPVKDSKHIVSLGEGLTPLMKADRLAALAGVSHLWVKDDGANPTGSFKARGMSCAVSMCVELGLSKIAVASAGNAGSALAAYAAAGGVEAHIFVPRDVPRSNYIECRAYGAHVTLVNGLISDCGRIIGERKNAEGWFDISGLKEPYRIEGKKTMGFEIA
jgi:threonine synthase